MPELSVLLPVRNGEAYLQRAVRTTLRAMPPDAELVVIDDASTDATAEIIARAAASDARVRLLQRQRSSGVADALNDALDTTRSRVVARMDADDVCAPWRFKRQLRRLEGVDFTFGSMVTLTAGGRPSGISTTRPISPAAARHHLLLGNYFAHSTMACVRSALAQLGGYSSTLVEDYELWLRASASGRRLELDPVPVLGYRVHAAQVTKVWSPSAADDVLDAAYGAILPDSLRDVGSTLRRDAISGTRTTPEGRAAWQRLAAWLAAEARHLPPSDRRALTHRMGTAAPR